MNKKLFNFKNAAIVAVFAFVAFIGFSAFKSTDKSLNSTAVLKWYTINIPPSGDPDELADQQVVPGSISTPPAIDPAGCARANAGDPCAVELSVPTAGYTLPSGVTMATLPSGVTFSAYAKQP